MMSFLKRKIPKKQIWNQKMNFLDDDYVDDDDLYDYERLDHTSGEDGEISVSVNADASEDLGEDGSLKAEEDINTENAAELFRSL